MRGEAARAVFLSDFAPAIDRLQALEADQSADPAAVAEARRAVAVARAAYYNAMAAEGLITVMAGGTEHQCPSIPCPICAEAGR